MIGSDSVDATCGCRRRANAGDVRILSDGDMTATRERKRLLEVVTLSTYLRTGYPKRRSWPYLV